MVLIALLIGAILIVVAFHGTQSNLFSALATDVPAFTTWAAAIVALGAIGFIPGLKPVSRALLALVIVVIVLRNYQSILAGFKSVSIAPGSQVAAQSPSDIAISGSNVSANAAPSAANIGTATSTLGQLSSFDGLAGFGSFAGVGQ